MPRMRQSSNTPQKTLKGKPNHYYKIVAQERVLIRRNYSLGRYEFFWKATGPVWCYSGLGLFLTRQMAHKQIMKMVHSLDRERWNPYARHEFFWAERINL